MTKCFEMQIAQRHAQKLPQNSNSSRSTSTTTISSNSNSNSNRNDAKWQQQQLQLSNVCQLLCNLTFDRTHLLRPWKRDRWFDCCCYYHFCTMPTTTKTTIHSNVLHTTAATATATQCNSSLSRHCRLIESCQLLRMRIALPILPPRLPQLLLLLLPQCPQCVAQQFVRAKINFVALSGRHGLP